jgi:T3SS negative regulator,GrlR
LSRPEGRYRLHEVALPEGQGMNGLWTAEFGSSSGIFGGGVAVLRDGTILGGDGGYYYSGAYELNEKTFKATLQVIPFIQNYPSVFTTVDETLTLELVGTLVDQEHLIAQGHPKGKPDLRFGAKLTKRI